MRRNSALFAGFYLFAVANIAQALVLLPHELTAAGLLQLFTYLLVLWLRPIAGLPLWSPSFWLSAFFIRDRHFTTSGTNPCRL